MDSGAGFDGYCGRLGPGLWAEPANLLSNIAFLLAAWMMWQRCRGMATGRVLAANLAVIGMGSALFHSAPARWTALADVLPIAAFVIAYTFVASRDFFALGRLWALPVTAVAVAALALLAPALGRLLPGANAAYAAVDLLLLGFGLALLPRDPRTAGRLIGGAALLALSITVRALDLPFCARWAVLTGLHGTHFLWHLLNAALLGWIIETWRRHRLAPAS